tara:strand:- start:583 stop:816 length:234 start_codon:yes stop_codon:yes gene_type:complete
LIIFQSGEINKDDIYNRYYSTSILMITIGGNFYHIEKYVNSITKDFSGGADQDRTDDLLNAIQALSQLSYSPMIAYL